MKPGKTRLRLLLLITFLESFATILVERGIYFFSKDYLSFTDSMNLWLALAFGVAYVIGSLLSHPASARIGEKPLLLAALASQVAATGALAFWANPVTLFAFNTALAFFYGMKWPVIESYVCAKQAPSGVARSLGAFNICWSSAVPVSLAAAGPLIKWHHADWQGAALFVSAAGLSALCLLLTGPLSRHVEHMPPDHPDRPPAELIPRYRSLLLASRFQMLVSYSGLWVLAALMPGIFERLGQPVTSATSLSGAVDVARLVMFVALSRYSGWHGRSGPLAIAMASLPVGFFLVLFGPTLAAVLVGEIIFGVAAGLVYYAALYYVMVVKNASVEAGGMHEALIGSGFALGPACQLLGVALAPVLHSRFLGAISGIGPLFAVCGAVAIWAMARGQRR